QRDSLAAALNAFANYKNLFRKIDGKGLSDDVKHIVLQGYSIEYAAKMVAGEDVAEEETAPVAREANELSADDRMIRCLEKRIKNLSTELGAKDAQIVKLKDNIAELKRKNHLRPQAKDETDDVTARNLKHKIGDLKGLLGQEKSVRKMLLAVIAGDAILVGTYPESVNGYALALNKVRAADTRGMDYKAVFTDVTANEKLFKGSGIPVYGTGLLDKVGDLWFADPLMLEKANNVSLEGLVEEYRSRRKDRE
ncbi:hypothetical protein ACFLRF_06355, partial [Candidatus Altiarchaeota archaeon]